MAQCFIILESSTYSLFLPRGPRFCVTHSTAVDAASAKLKFWHTCQERPRVDIDPFPQIVSLLPLTQKSGIPPSLLQVSRITTLKTKLCPIRNNDKNSLNSMEQERGTWFFRKSRFSQCLDLIYYILVIYYIPAGIFKMVMYKNAIKFHSTSCNKLL